MEGSRNHQPLLFFCFVVHLIILVHAQNTTLINQTCSQTPKYDLCVSTLNKDPARTRIAQNARDIATIVVLAVGNKATETRDYISGSLKDPKIDAPTKQLLNQCMNMYNTTVIKSVWETLQGFRDREYGFAKSSISAVQINVESCEKSFVPPTKSPISAYSKATDDLAIVAAAIVDYMVKNPPPNLPTIFELYL